jgi:hypothetical protein
LGSVWARRTSPGQSRAARLSPDDLAEIDTLDGGYRIMNPAKAPVWD